MDESFLYGISEGSNEEVEPVLCLSPGESGICFLWVQGVWRDGVAIARDLGYDITGYGSGEAEENRFLASEAAKRVARGEAPCTTRSYGGGNYTKEAFYGKIAAIMESDYARQGR